MGFKNFEEIISFALEKEREAVAFYEDLSGQETYSGLKETFESFANEERKHIALLEDMEKSGVEEHTGENIIDLKRSDYLVDVQYRSGMPYNEVLRIAMKREEKAVKLYTDLSSKSSAEDIQGMFQRLTQEESKHKLRLETMYDDYMAKEGD